MGTSLVLKEKPYHVAWQDLSSGPWKTTVSLRDISLWRRLHEGQRIGENGTKIARYSLLAANQFGSCNRLEESFYRLCASIFAGPLLPAMCLKLQASNNTWVEQGINLLFLLYKILTVNINCAHLLRYHLSAKPSMADSVTSVPPA